MQGPIIGKDSGFHSLAVSLPQNGWNRGRAGAATSALERWPGLAEAGKLPVMRYGSFPNPQNIPIIEMLAKAHAHLT